MSISPGLHAAISVALPLYLAAYGLAAFAWPLYRTWKAQGINAFALGQSDNVHDFIGKLFLGIMMGCVMVAAVYIVFPAKYPYLAPLAWLERPAAVYAGLALLGASLLWTVAAQASLGASWRIGVDHNNPSALVHAGVYRYSRNPIFLGMRGTALGFFLVLPNAVTLAILALGEALIHIQVRLEEEFLHARHGDAYLEYCRATRRWI